MLSGTYFSYTHSSRLWFHVETASAIIKCNHTIIQCIPVISRSLLLKLLTKDSHTCSSPVKATQIAKFMGPTWDPPAWVLSAPCGPHVSPMDLTIRGSMGVSHEFEIWPTFYGRSCFPVCNILSYCTATYRESMVHVDNNPRYTMRTFFIWYPLSVLVDEHYLLVRPPPVLHVTPYDISTGHCMKTLGDYIKLALLVMCLFQIWAHANPIEPGTALLDLELCYDFYHFFWIMSWSYR